MILLLLVGLAAGFISGLMGVGGGIIMTPVLHYALGYDWTTSVSISLYVIAIQAPIGIWRHQKRGAVSWPIAGGLIASGAVGVAIGGWLLPRFPVSGLKLLFAVVMVGAAWRLWKQTDGTRTMPRGILLPLGVAAGILSRILGIGGGILTVPALALMGIAPTVAVASSLVPVATNAWIATLSGPTIPFQDVWPLLAAIAGAPLGVRAAHSIEPGTLRSVVALALASTACLIAWSVAI